VNPGRRRLLSRALAATAVFAVLFAALLSYAEETLFDSKTFSNRAVSVLDDEAVQDQLTSAIADAAISEVPNAVAARPVIESVAALIVRSPALQSLLASGIADVHSTVIAGDSDTLVVTLANVGVLVRQGLQSAAPRLANRISRQLDVELVTDDDVDGEGIVIDATQVGHDLNIAHWIALAFALIAAALSVHFAGSRLAGVRRLGRSLALGAVVAVILWQIGRGLVVAQFDGDAADVARAVFDAFLVDLRTWLLVLAGTGIVITAGATSTREPVDVAEIAGRAWARITTVPGSTLARVLRALLLIALGVIVLENRTTFVEITVIAVAAFVVYVGAAELMRMAAVAVRAGEAASGAGEEDLSAGGLFRVVAVGALLLGGFVLLGIGSNEKEVPPLKVDTCNGSVELCDRRLDQVAFAGTHNSMSAASYDNWFFAQHDKGISEQLTAGIRALLIDPHYGVASGGGVATDLEADRGSREKIESGLGPEAIAAAEQIRRQIGFDEDGETEVFLCHGFCEVGAIRWTEGLREVKDFLVANPGEVVVMSIEYATTPEDTVAGFDEVGLTDLVYKGPDEPLPTLREMIDLDQRLFVMAERDGGDPSWYRRQFDITQETPFKFEDPEELTKPKSCKPNRGPRDAPLFLLNNWVDTSPAPRPTNAKIVNRKKFLLDRVELCDEVRGIEPRILAVDFYKEGDVVGAASALNGIDE
jgi:hypothetical protein